jgi:hypothetical protein
MPFVAWQFFPGETLKDILDSKTSSGDPLASRDPRCTIMRDLSTGQVRGFGTLPAGVVVESQMEG